MGRTDGEPIRVLHVDDDADLVSMAATYLERARDDIEVITETSASDGLDRLSETTVDCIVSDYDMPETDGLEFLEAVREFDPELPFILFTGKGSEEIASEAISAGVTDYLQKEVGPDQYMILANRIERAVDATRARDALAESERMFSTLISNLPGMVYRCRNEPNWPMEFVSNGCLDVTGYDAARLESGEIKWGEDVLHPDDRERMWDAVQSAIDDDEPFEVTYRIITADGETRWLWEQGECISKEDGTSAIEGFITDITDRKTAEERRRKYEKIVESMDVGVFTLDTNRQFEFVNQTFAVSMGLDRESLSGRDSLYLAETPNIELSDDYAELLDRLQHGESDQGRTKCTVDLAERGTRALTIQLTRLEEDDTFEGIVGVVRDVTDSRERKQELERYEELVEAVGDPMYALDETATITMVNEAMANHLNCSREDVVGSHVSTFMPEKDVETGTEMIGELITNDDQRWASFEMETVGKGGERKQTEDKIAILTDENGEYAGSVGVIRDITERKKRERELERYETIIQAVGDPVYSLDPDGVFTFVNEAIEPVAGYTPDDLVGEDVSILMPDEDVEEARGLIKELLASENRTNGTFEMDLVTQNDTHIPSENHMALLPFEDDDFRGTAGVVRDITERKQREQRLKQFASVVSHDLRNPLNVIKGRIEIARETGDLDHLDAAKDSVGRMEHLIDDLLTLAQQGQTVGETEQLSLDETVQLAWQQVDTERATLQTDDTLGTVLADSQRIRELLENLFRNAVEHGSAAESGAGDDVTVHVSRIDDDARTGFVVADDGPGIPAEDRDRVFDHGYTDGEEGTGFGLSIVKNIVDAHGWSISVTESESGGARFEIIGLD